MRACVCVCVCVYVFVSVSLSISVTSAVREVVVCFAVSMVALAVVFAVVRLRSLRLFFSREFQCIGECVCVCVCVWRIGECIHI